LRECAEQWSLELEQPFAYAFASLAVPAGDVVLKIQFPDRESEHEAEALRVWDGDGAVRLLEHNPERHALLLERARPGTALAGLRQDEALDVVAGLLPRLWKPAGAPFRPVADDAAWWVSYLPERWEQAGRPFERSLPGHAG
jgi:streptomycin 6-kinase